MAETATSAIVLVTDDALWHHFTVHLYILVITISLAEDFGPCDNVRKNTTFHIFVPFLQDWWPWTTDYLIKLVNFGHDLDRNFSRSNIEFAICLGEKIIRWNEKQTFQFNFRPQVWPLVLTLAKTLTFKVKYLICHVSGQNDLIATTWKNRSNAD